ncbi:MAG: hypothetical protein QF471_05665 [Phycisphaerales bacterium]|jgi:hypothetical protein|nr:hypothetical protein [Phycisphaerales bacterium]
MTGFDSPIQVAINTSRLYMEGLHAVLDLRFQNTSVEEHFGVEIHLDSRVLATLERKVLRLHAGSTRTQTVSLHLPRPTDTSIGSAGDARLDIEVIIDAGDDGKHRFTGECTLAVLAYTEDRQDINVNVHRLIETSGERGGMGAINEIDLSNLINLPDTISVNDLINRERTPSFVMIDLFYEGRVEDRPSPLLARPGDALSKCVIEDAITSTRLLVLTGETVALGKDRAEADIVTWKMPRTDANDRESRKVSGKQCRFVRTSEHLVIQHLSAINPTRLDKKTVLSAKQIKRGQIRELTLPGEQRLHVLPLPMAELPEATLDTWKDAAGPSFRNNFEWSRRTGIGGLLIRRSDALANQEYYLWILSLVEMPDLAATSRGTSPPRFGIATLPRLHVFPLNGTSSMDLANRTVPENFASPILIDDAVGTPPNHFHVREWCQSLEVPEAVSTTRNL